MTVKTLQSTVVMAALPFSVPLILMVIGLNRALHQEPQSPHRGKRPRISHDPLTESSSPPEEHRRESGPSDAF